jgi:hypothetical protein
MDTKWICLFHGFPVDNRRCEVCWRIGENDPSWESRCMCKRVNQAKQVKEDK